MTIALSKTAQSIPPNVFERMDRTVAQARARGVDVIDLSKGNPDGFPEARIRAEAKEAVDSPENARYTPFDGKPLFLQAAVAWYAHEHSVALDPGTQLFAVEGAVDGLPRPSPYCSTPAMWWRSSTRTTRRTIAWPGCSAPRSCRCPRTPSWVGCRTSTRCRARHGTA